MSISTFFSTSVASLPSKTSWFSERANNATVGSAQVTTAEPEEGRLGDMLSMLNAIGSLYSVPYLLYQKGYDYPEIASRLKVPEGAVKSRVFTARVKMKQLIAERKSA